MNDYVTRRRSFKIFRIASALTMPPFSMKKKVNRRGNFFARNYTFLLYPLGNFKIHKRSTLTKIDLIQKFYLELSWKSTVIQQMILSANLALRLPELTSFHQIEFIHYMSRHTGCHP